MSEFIGNSTEVTASQIERSLPLYARDRSAIATGNTLVPLAIAAELPQLDDEEAAVNLLGSLGLQGATYTLRSRTEEIDDTNGHLNFKYNGDCRFGLEEPRHLTVDVRHPLSAREQAARRLTQAGRWLVAGSVPHKGDLAVVKAQLFPPAAEYTIISVTEPAPVSGQE